MNCFGPSGKSSESADPLAYNMAHFLRTQALPVETELWLLTTLREKVVKVGTRVIAHARYTVPRWPKWPCRGTGSGASRK